MFEFVSSHVMTHAYRNDMWFAAQRREKRNTDDAQANNNNKRTRSLLKPPTPMQDHTSHTGAFVCAA
jgi:hypothetical protein